jgi:hypothetical protein
VSSNPVLFDSTGHPSCVLLTRLTRSLGLLAMPWLLVATAAAQSTNFSPEERLEAIRHGLVQAALEGATRVESLTWIDGQGVLREGSSFRSGMEVRGVQVLSYLRDSAGQAQAQLLLPSESSSKIAALPNRKDIVREILTPAQKCSNPAALRHLVGLRMTVEGGWPVDQAPSAQALGLLTAALLQQVGGTAVGWSMLERSAAAHSGYERVLVGTSADQLPWQAVLSVRPVPPLPAAEKPPFFAFLQLAVPDQPVMARLSFSLVARGQNTPIFEASAEIEMPRQAQVWGRPMLEASVREQAAHLIQPWTQALAQQFSCSAVRPDVIAVSGAQLSINAGALAGVRTGDEWLLADPRRFPQQILASGVAATSVLARVGQVYPHHAQLQIVAGPGNLVRTDWRAWRADSSIGK